jgi:iron complex outermembrane recepter protein
MFARPVEPDWERKMLRFCRMTLLGSVSIVTLLAAPALAQARPADTGAADDGQLQEIVVTAQKREQSINKVGMSITALAGSDLTRRGVTSVADLAKVVPGFTYTPTPFNSPVYTIRGIGFYEATLSATPAVTVYTDEVPLPFAAMTKAAGLDLERVEVLKGPQGTLFGQNSTGGAINYIAAKPTDTLKAGIDASYGRFNAADVQAYLSGPLSDTLKARLAVRGIHEDDWQYSYTRHDSNGHNSEFDGRLLLDWRPSDRATFLLNVNGWHDKGDTQAPQLIAITPQVPSGISPLLVNYPLAPHNDRAADWTPGFPHRNDSFFQVSLRGDYELTDAVKLTSISAYQRYKTTSRNEYDATDLQIADTPAHGHINSFVQELRLSGNTPRLNWIVGANYERDRTYDFSQYNVADSSNSVVFPDIPFAVATNFSGQNMKTLAGFANADYKLLDTLTIVGGVRYTDSKRDFAGCTSGDANVAETFARLSAAFTGGPEPALAPGDCVTLETRTDPAHIAAFGQPVLVTGKLDQHNVSWRAGLNWQAASTMLLYANVSKGYKSGSYPTLSGGFSVQYAPVVQEAVMAYEAGFKASLADRHAQLNGAAFYYDYTNKQLRGKFVDPIFGVLEGLQNIPKSRIWGLEGQLITTPLSGLDLNVGATYLNTRIRRFIGVSNTGITEDFAGNRFPFSPKYQANFDGQYKWAMGTVEPFVGMGLVYNSSTNSSIGEEDLTRIKAYTLVDARLGFGAPDDRWRVTGWVRNLFNTYYWTNALRGGDTTMRWAGEPRTFGVSLKYRFD